MVCVDLRTNSLFSPYIINLLVIIAETVCVSPVIRTESSSIMQVNVSRYGALPPRVVSACGCQHLCPYIAIIAHVTYAMVINIP
jgi:hypothetical protein